MRACRSGFSRDRIAHECAPTKLQIFLAEIKGVVFMPTLQFKGKNIIWNHHLSIPYHTLEEVPTLDFQPGKGDGNLIIEGDNLLALKALLPQYAGKIKCVYIDPPYNTGNEGWIYNDNVNSPLIKDWLGAEVGRDDLTRHDKWLCMMVPRLKLLRELLSDDGAIFVSIDDYEQSNLKCIMSELFGEDNFVGQFVWKRRASSMLAENQVSGDHEYVLCFKKDLMREFLGQEKDFSKYSNPDDDPRGEWVLGDLTVGMTKEQRPNQFYPLSDPKTKRIFQPNPNRVWAYIPASMNRLIEENRIYFPEDDSKRPMIKRYKADLENKKNPISTWLNDVGLNTEATKMLQGLLGGKSFEYSKPLSLVKTLIKQLLDQDDIILDSFAGSGTTMHAVMDLNKEDGGNRKCILVQMTEATEKEPKKNICKDITRERVKRAIEKYGYKSGFKYLRIGNPIDPESMLSGVLPTYKQFAKYVYYLCTGEYLQDESKLDEKKYFVGAFKKQAIYLVYNQYYDILTRLALNLPLAENMVKAQKGKKIVIYAPACFLDEEYLEEKNIEFVGIPYNLFKKNGQ